MRRTPQPTLEMSDARQQGLFNIGEASEASGVSTKMIRHYESIGVIPPADRTFSNYRVYSQNDVHTLQFIRRARDLGFSMKQIQELLGLWQGHRSSREVRKVALSHVAELEEKIREMEAMKRTLETLASHCHGDDRPECPILDDLAHHERQVGGHRSKVKAGTS